MSDTKLGSLKRRAGGLIVCPDATDKLGFFGVTPVVRPTAIPALTGAFGSTGSAIADATATFSQSIMNNNFRALEDKVNAILAALQGLGLLQ